MFTTEVGLITELCVCVCVWLERYGQASCLNTTEAGWCVRRRGVPCNTDLTLPCEGQGGQSDGNDGGVTGMTAG